MSLLDRDHLSSFLKGFSSVLDLHPRIDVPLKFESHVVVPENDFESLLGDWEAIGNDFKKVMKEHNGK